MRLCRLIILLLTAWYGVPTTLRAEPALEWPYFQGNRDHNGRMTAAGGINTPAIRAAQRIGGDTTPFRLRFGDFVHGPQPELLVVESGRLYLKTTKNKTVWHTDALGITEIVGIHDLDKDGGSEVVVSVDGPDAQIAIFSLKKGQLLWHFDQFGSGSGIIFPTHVAIADFNGDNYLDLVCSARMNDDTTHAFTFADGFASNGADNLMWEAPQKNYGQLIPYLVGDLDGDSQAEIAYLEYQHLSILDGARGAEETRESGVFESYSFGPTALTNVDDDDALEIVAIGEQWYNLAITVYDASPGSEEIRWQYQWYPTTGKRLVSTNRSIGDVDGDGETEIVVGIYNDADDELVPSAVGPNDFDGVNEPNRWITAVFSADDGTIESYFLDHKFLGIAPLQAGEPPHILTRPLSAGDINPSKFGTITAFHFRDNEYESVNIANRAQPLVETDLGTATTTSARRLLVVDLDNDDRAEIFIEVDSDADGNVDTIESIEITESSAIRRAWIAVEDWHDYEPLSIWRSHHGEVNLVWKHSNGELHLLNKSLEVIERTRLGEFSTTPLSADLDGDNANEVLATNSSGQLGVFEHKFVGLDPSWHYQTSQDGPIIVVDREGDGTNEVAVAEFTDYENPKLTLLDNTGSVIWQHLFANYGIAVRLLSSGDFSGDETLDFVVSITDSRLPTASNIRVIALDGSSGAELWNVPANYNRYVTGTLHVDDRTGDGIDDVTIVDTHDITTFDGTNGTIVDTHAYSQWASTHFSADIDDDNDNELVLVNYNGLQGIQLYEFGEANPVWNIPHAFDFELSYSWPSCYDTGTGLGVIKATPSGRIEAYDSSGSPTWGPLWSRQGQLTAVDPGGANNIPYVVVADIDDNGVEEAIFGTEDGYLLAVSTVDGSLTWSLPLYSPSGPLALSDVDGDGRLEVIVSTKSGYLFIVDERSLGSPKAVRDISMSEFGTTSLSTTAVEAEDDADTTSTRTTLGASWNVVQGADGYLVSAIDADGILLQPWTDVGNVNSTVITTAPLPLDSSYRVVVKAYTNEGDYSRESASDGIHIQDELPPFTDLNVTPSFINPKNGNAYISIDLADNTWLGRYNIAIFREEAIPITETSAALYGTSHADTLIWPGDFVDRNLLSDGMYTIQISSIDDAGNTNATSSTITIDTVPPEPASIRIEIAAENQPRFSGIAEPEGFVTVAVNGAAICEASADTSGNWNCQGETLLPNGEYSAQAEVEDRAGNRSDPSATEVFQLTENEPRSTSPAAPMATVPGVTYEACACRAAGAPVGRNLFSLARLLWLMPC